MRLIDSDGIELEGIFFYELMLCKGTLHASMDMNEVTKKYCFFSMYQLNLILSLIKFDRIVTNIYTYIVNADVNKEFFEKTNQSFTIPTDLFEF